MAYFIILLFYKRFSPQTRETERFMLLQRVVNGSDTWTSLQLVNDYIQEVAKYTSKPIKVPLSTSLYEMKLFSFLTQPILYAAASMLVPPALAVDNSLPTNMIAGAA
jgi:hypothetical protein